MKNEKNPPVEKGASLSENGSSVGNKMEAKILRSLMRSSKWHYCFNASCSKAQECGSRSNPRTSWQSRTDHAVGKGYLVIYSPPYR